MWQGFLGSLRYRQSPGRRGRKWRVIPPNMNVAVPSAQQEHSGTAAPPVLSLLLITDNPCCHWVLFTPSCSRAGVKPGNESPAALCLSPCPALGPFLPSCVWVGNKGALIPVEIKTCCLPAQLGGHKEICVSSHSLAIPLKASLLIYTYICSLLYVAFTTYEMETL